MLAEATEPGSRTENWFEWEALLTGADYRFAWFDGLNRFYVAAEQWAALKHAFVVPPNVFDQWIQPRGKQQRALLDRAEFVANAALNAANTSHAAMVSAQADAAAARDAIAQKDAHARALEDAIAQKDGHARALEDAIAQKDGHARALEDALAEARHQNTALARQAQQAEQQISEIGEANNALRATIRQNSEDQMRQLAVLRRNDYEGRLPRKFIGFRWLVPSRRKQLRKLAKGYCLIARDSII